MEIKSSLLKYKEFNNLKNSLAKISEIDGKDKFRVKMVEYINDTSDNNDDMFFYDMLPFSRFLKPSDSAIAYTTPDHLIYLNAPGKVGEKVRVWDFIYCHECLHQLWDTFEVGDKIKKAGIEYNHKLLNIASDCVINDYLRTLRKKDPFSEGIFPETLKEEFDIDYDRKNDTQYSLYIKLLKAYKENKEKMDELADKMEKQEGGQGQSGGEDQSEQSNGSGGSGSSGNSGSSGGSSDNNSSKDLTADDAQKAADEAKKHAEGAQKQANSNKAEKEAGKTPACDPEESQEHADKAKDAAKRAQEAADKAKECADKGDEEGEKKAAKEAQDAANEAESESMKAGGLDVEGNNSSSSEDGDNDEDSEGGDNGGDEGKSGSKGKGGKKSSTDNTTSDVSPEELAEIRKSAEEVINKYKEKLTGHLGEFLAKCKSSGSLKKEGLQVNTLRGQAGWNTQMNQICKGFVKKKVFQKKRQFEKTYTRVRRGSGFIKYGQPIEPGRKVKEDKMNLSVSFYIDRSGSMEDSIDNVFKAAFYISDSLKKHFGKEKVIDEKIFETYAFDYSLHKLKFGQTMRANGGTMSFNDLLKCISENTKDFLINVIITDAGFSNIDVSNIKDLLKEIDGILIFITNQDNETMKELSKKYPTQLYYILADRQFKLD